MQNTVKELINIEYPGIVKNVDKMLETLGGKESLENTFSQANSRLELFFRPKDIYSHSTLGDRVNTHNLLVKCTKRTTVDSEGKVTVVYESQIVGIIKTCYQFKGLADFQYLPLQPVKPTQANSSNSYKSIIESLIPQKPFNSLQCFNKNAPIFIIPPIFSRFDSTSSYFYRENPKHRDEKIIKEVARQSDLSIIGRFRKPRNILACLMNWEQEIPQEPNPQLLESAKAVSGFFSYYQELVNLFSIRPIWSRNALLYKLKCNRIDIKYILPSVAYYYINGPFRCLWVKFGFDPKHNKLSKIYQTLDFRVKHAYNRNKSKDKIAPKRTIYQGQLSIKRKEMDKNKERFKESLIEQNAFHPSSSSNSSGKREEKLMQSFIFKEGLLPSSRQLFYQLCDIQVAQVQLIIHNNDGKEPDVCDDKDGWCESGAIEKIRSIMNSIVEETLKGENIEQQQAQQVALTQDYLSDDDVDTNYDDDDDDDDDEETVFSKDEYLTYMS